MELPVNTWEACLRIARQIRRAELRNWQLAVAELSTDLRHSLASFESQVADILRELPSPTVMGKIVTTNDIYKDLVALGEEFEETNYDHNGCWLSVTTEPLELEGVFLGPFEIRLDWRRGQNSYRVIATDPHPSESRENVTHPHVMDDLLCEGEGKLAIRQALAQGRLLDFFTLVAGILRNYNPESPFVELALWYGQSTELGVPTAVFATAYHSLAEPAMRGHIRSMADRIIAACDQLGLCHSPISLEQLAKTKIDTFYKSVLPYPDAEATLVGIRALGLRVGLLSNACTYSMDVIKKMNMSDYFDATLYSCEVGLLKPDPDIYRLLLDRLGMKPTQCVHVGDGGDHELAGARAAGIATILIDRRLPHCSAARNDACWVVPDLTEVMNLLRSTLVS
jgi:putative hydrolase of the HAD superfamily